MDPGSMPMEKFHEAQAALLQQMLGKMGEGSFIEQPLRLDYGCNVIMGKNCFANFKYVVAGDLGAVVTDDAGAESRGLAPH